MHQAWRVPSQLLLVAVTNISGTPICPPVCLVVGYCKTELPVTKNWCIVQKRHRCHDIDVIHWERGDRQALARMVVVRGSAVSSRRTLRGGGSDLGYRYREAELATIYDVAKHAGVSPKTVSRVLNAEEPVSDKTRVAVAEAIEALSYIPSHAARSMKSRKSGLVGLITGAISTVTGTNEATGLPDLFIVQGIQKVVQAADKTLLIADTGGQLQRVPELVKTFRQHRVEGLLFVADFHKKLDIPLPINDVPTVLVNCFDDKGTPSVVPDDESGQLALTRQVVKAGHERIAYLSFGTTRIATRLRLKGFKEALREAGVEVDPKLIAPVEMPDSIGEHQLVWDALDRFFREDNPPTAICCGNDRIAMTVYGILRERGVSIPGDVSVIGYDDYRSICESLYPMLTTAELPYNAMGARAAHLLFDMLETEGKSVPSESVRVGGPVRLRDSLVPPVTSGGTVIKLDRRTTP